MQTGPAETRTGVWCSEDATQAFGLSLARRLQPGDCIALVGEMGAGKTTLARAIAEGCQVNVAAEFASPTYTYANEYAAPLPLVHMDLYRVADEEAAEALGLVELAARTDAAVLIEWADRLPGLLVPHAVWLYLHADAALGQRRAWRAVGPGHALARLLAEAST